MTTYNDNFTGTDNTALQTYSSNWASRLGSWVIYTNGAAPDSVSSDSIYQYTQSVGGNDQFAEATISTISGGVYVGVAVRVSGSAATCYGIYVTSSDSEMFKIVNGTYTRLGPVGGAWAAGDVIRLQVVGSTLTPYRNGSVYSAIGAQTDSSITTGNPGITGYQAHTSGTPRLDSWSGGDIGGAIALAAAASDVAAASAALTTQIKAAAAAADVASSTGALTTAIRLAMTAVSNVAAAGALTTGIPLGGSAADVATATAGLASGAVMNAAANDVVTAVASLTTSFLIAAAAQSVSAASGVLTNWATVTLSGSLYTGQGGVLDPNFWVDAVPTLGTTLYYDSTHIAIYPNGEISSDSNNCAAVVQFYDGTGALAVGLIVITPQMAAVAVNAASATGQLSTAIRLAAAASTLATATAAFSTGAGLTAAASDTATAVGTLTTQIPFSALASAVATAAGALTTQIRLQAAAISSVTATGSLNGVSAMNAAATAVSSMIAALTTAIPVSGSASDSAAAGGTLTTGISLAGAAQDAVNAAAAIATAITLGGAASNAVSATADLTTAQNLVAAAIDVATAVATISTGIRLAANAAAISQASADLSGFVHLLADASAQSSATGELTDVITNPPIGAYASDPRFYVYKPKWSFFTTRRTPRFDVKDVLESVVLTFDLNSVLAADEYFSGAITLSISTIAGSDASPTSLLYSVPSYDMTKRKILQPVRAGVSGCTYYVKVAATTNTNRKVALTGLLPVRG